MPLDFPLNPVNGQVYENFYYDSTLPGWRNAGTKNGLSQRMAALETAPNRILQVVHGYTSTIVSSSTTSWVDTTLSATITPKSTTSKILVIVSHGDLNIAPSGTIISAGFKLVRNTTDIISLAGLLGYSSSLFYVIPGPSISWYDSPATTSAVTYKTQFQNTAASAQVRLHNYGGTSTITLIELSQ